MPTRSLPDQAYRGGKRHSSEFLWAGLSAAGRDEPEHRPRAAVRGDDRNDVPICT